MVKNLVALSLLVTPLAAFASEGDASLETLRKQALEDAYKIDSELTALTLRGQRPPPMFPGRMSNTVYGPTGLVFIPTSSVASDGSLVLGGTWTDPFVAFSANFGVNDNLEIGGAIIEPDGPGDSIFLGNAKLRISPSDSDRYEFAVGILDAFDEIDNSLYVVGSARVVVPNYTADKGAIGFNVHAGVGGGLFEGRLFFGGELLFADNFSVIAEWDSRNFNAAARFNINDDFTAMVGTYSGVANSNNNDLFISFTYRLRQ